MYKLTKNIELYDTKKTQITEDKKKKILKSVLTMCNNQITKEYAEESIDNSDYVLVSYDHDNKKGKERSIRGFCNLQIFVNNSNEKYLYIDLICSAQQSARKTKSNVNITRGKDLLEEIDILAIILKCKYIELKALEHVIPYYYKFGYRFKNNCETPEKKELKQYVNDLKKLLISADTPYKLKELQISKNYIKILNKFSSYMHGFYSDTLMSQPRKPNNDTYKEELRNNGYSMIKCLDITSLGKKSKRKTPQKTKRQHKKKSKRHNKFLK